MRTELLLAAGGLGVFLVGMKTMTEGLRALAGDRLQHALARGTRSPARGALLGTGITALIQSSSATTVAAVGFVGAGVLAFPQALGIVFGANLGTTFTGWLVAAFGFHFDLGATAQLLALAGALLLLLGRGRAGAAGRALAGFALLFIGLDALKDGFAAMPDLFAPERLPPDTWAGRALLVAIGCAATMLMQSSSAGVAAALAALHAGSLTLPQALALVVGMDIGTSFTAALAALGGSLAMRRTGFAHVVFNALSALPGYLLLPPFVFALARLDAAPDPGFALVAFHSAYNLLGVLLAVPLARPFARLITFLVRERRRPRGRLDPSVARDPDVAVPACAAALLRFARRAAAETAELLALLPAGAESARARVHGLRHDLEEQRADLGIVSTGPPMGHLHVRHLALLHAADHLERLLDRLEEWPRPAALADGGARAWAGELAAAARSLGEGSPEELLPRARRVHDDFDASLAAARNETMRRSAEGSLPPGAALDVLDEIRRLQHLALHLWRALHYLCIAREPGSPAGAA